MSDITHVITKKEAFTIQIGWTWTVSVLSFPVRVSSSAAEGFPVSEFILVKVFLGPGLCGKVFLYCRSGHSSSNLIKAFTSVSGCLFQKKLYWVIIRNLSDSIMLLSEHLSFRMLSCFLMYLYYQKIIKLSINILKIFLFSIFIA